MELLQLKYFCHAAETENFSHTANHFKVPASNISQCIKRLEKELDTALFTRTHNSLRLNSNGKKFYEKIKKALADIDSARNAVTTKAALKELKICALTNRQLVMNAAEKFRAANKDTKLVITHSYDENEYYNLIISDDRPELAGYRKTSVVSENMVLAVSQENPLSQKIKITADDLKNENFATLNSESSMYKTTVEICRRMNFEPNIVIQSPDPYYVRKCVELNLGITFFPEISWRGQFDDSVKIIKFTDYMRTTYAFVGDDCGKRDAEEILGIINSDLSLSLINQNLQ